LVPEEEVVALVWSLVVNACGWDDAALMAAVVAERMVVEVDLTGLLPSVVVAAVVRCTSSISLLMVGGALVLEAVAGEDEC
jgi:hypothetical protein